MDLSEFEWIWHNFDECSCILTLFDTLTGSKIQKRVFVREKTNVPGMLDMYTFQTSVKMTNNS